MGHDRSFTSVFCTPSPLSQALLAESSESSNAKLMMESYLTSVSKHLPGRHFWSRDGVRDVNHMVPAFRRLRV